MPSRNGITDPNDRRHNDRRPTTDPKDEFEETIVDEEQIKQIQRMSLKDEFWNQTLNLDSWRMMGLSRRDMNCRTMPPSVPKSEPMTASKVWLWLMDVGDGRATKKRSRKAGQDGSAEHHFTRANGHQPSKDFRPLAKRSDFLSPFLVPSGRGGNRAWVTLLG